MNLTCAKFESGPESHRLFYTRARCSTPTRPRVNQTGCYFPSEMGISSWSASRLLRELDVRCPSPSRFPVQELHYDTGCVFGESAFGNGGRNLTEICAVATR